MKCIAMVAVLLIPVGGSAQSIAEVVEDALAPLPARLAEGAAVIKWNSDFTYETLKEGTNRWVCYGRADERDRSTFAVQCTSLANLDRVAQNRQFRVESADAQEEQASVAAADENGSRLLPEYGSMWVSMNGRDRASATIHSNVAVPHATSESTGLPESRSQGGAWVMAAGTSEAHIMVPGR